MSKSLPNGAVFLLDDPKVITKRLKSAVTDSETEVRFDPANKPGVSNLLTILGAFTGRDVDSLVKDYDGKGYGALKGDTAEAVVAFAQPFAARVAELHVRPGRAHPAHGGGCREGAGRRGRDARDRLRPDRASSPSAEDRG